MSGGLVGSVCARELVVAMRIGCFVSRQNESCRIPWDFRRSTEAWSQCHEYLHIKSWERCEHSTVRANTEMIARAQFYRSSQTDSSLSDVYSFDLSCKSETGAQHVPNLLNKIPGSLRAGKLSITSTRSVGCICTWITTLGMSC